MCKSCIINTADCTISAFQYDRTFHPFYVCVCVSCFSFLNYIRITLRIIHLSKHDKLLVLFSALQKVSSMDSSSLSHFASSLTFAETC